MKEELQKTYATLRELKLADIKKGNISKGLAYIVENLKLTDEEIQKIISSWHMLGLHLEIRLYQYALLRRDIEELKQIDIIYLDILNAEKLQKRG